MRAASGQMYRRNRYYDPATGQFTQADPIGIAGGLNTYGFGDGDPVSYSDPYGLCPQGQWDMNSHPLVEQCIAAIQVGVLVGPVAQGWRAGVTFGRNALGRASTAIGGVRRAFAIMREARAIVNSSGMATLRRAAAQGVQVEVQIGGRTVVYVPGMHQSISGMTLHGENGFAIGGRVFSSQAETMKTVLHELFRLSTASRIGSATTAARETADAWRFAETAYNVGKGLRLW
jgi:hypothetical protein